MSFEQSDLHDRLPLFEAYKSAIGDTSGRAYDYIDPTVTSMMTGCVPVGLKPDGTLAIPKSYEPEEGPLVLMLRQDEIVDVRWSEGMEKTTHHVLKLANATRPSDLDSVVLSTSGGVAYTQSITFNVSSPRYPEKIVEPVIIPVFLGLRPLVVPVDPSTVLLHECDHWDFYLNTAPFFSSPDATPLPAQYKNALAEKRAYTTEYTQITNMGLTAHFMTAEQLADTLSGNDPLADVRAACEQVRRLPERHVASHVATVAVALSLRYADPNPTIQISKQEVEAYLAAGLIA